MIDPEPEPERMDRTRTEPERSGSVHAYVYHRRRNIKNLNLLNLETFVRKLLFLHDLSKRFQQIDVIYFAFGTYMGGFFSSKNFFIRSFSNQWRESIQI